MQDKRSAGSIWQWLSAESQQATGFARLAEYKVYCSREGGIESIVKGRAEHISADVWTVRRP